VLATSALAETVSGGRSLAAIVAEAEEVGQRCTFDVDVLPCPRCGGRLRLIGTVEDPEAIGAILTAASREEAGRAPPSAAAQTPNRAAALGA
jgi:hypothetical protein